MAKRDRILIAEDTPEIAAVLEAVLVDEGHDADCVTSPEALLRAVQEQTPGAIAVGLPPDPEAAGELLDALRVDPIARQVPVLAMGTVPQITDAAAASYTVQETLEKPFDLDDAIAKFELTLGQPPVQALVPDEAPEGIAATAEAVLAEQSRAMLLRLADRLRSETPGIERRDAPVSEVLGSTPAIVDALDASLRLEEPASLLEAHPEAAALVRARARRRRARTVGGEQPREIVLLREELRGMLTRELPPDVAESDAAELERIVNASLERIVEVALPTQDPEAP